MISTWVWIKKYWEYLAATALLFLGVFLGVELKKRPVVVAGEDLEKKEIEDETAKKETAILQKAQREELALKEEHAQKIESVVDQEKKAEPALEKDPDATNAYLKEVGRLARGDDNGGQQ